MLTKAILILDIAAVSALIVLTLLKIIDLIVASFLLAAIVGVVGWVLNYLSKPQK